MFTRLSHLLIIGLVAITAQISAQSVGININSPHPSAILHVASGDKGLLIPSMNSTQRAAIISPENGLLVYDVTTKSFWYYNASVWVNISKGVFANNGGIIHHTGNSESDDFVFGSTELPPNALTSDTLMLFDKSKGAFRTGRLLNSNSWASDSIGRFSFAAGHNVRASGDFSISLGESNLATRVNAIAIGKGSIAKGNTAFAGGSFATSSGFASVAFGAQTTATGYGAMAFGYNTDATGDYALAAGQTTVASGSASVALGSQTTATRTGSTALGLQTMAAGNFSLSAGRGTRAQAYNSTALGSFNTGTGTETSWVDTDPILEVGIGTSDGNRQNALTVFKNGDFIVGRDALPPATPISANCVFYDVSKRAFRSGRISASGAWAPDSIGIYSFANGFNVTASGSSSISMGESSVATAPYAVAIGYGNSATGVGSIAIGYNLSATGYASTAFGRLCVASGGHSFSAGNINQALGNYATAFGRECLAAGVGSFAIGREANALGDYSTAIGYFNFARGSRSTAMGSATRADAYASTAMGVNNIGGGDSLLWILTDPLFEIGNGFSGPLSNALTVLKNGNVGISTATPDAPLQIFSDASSTIPQLKLTESVANDGARIIFDNSIETDNRWTLYGRADDTDNNSYFNIFYNNAGNIITATGLGNVGIKGTPDADLHVRHINSGGSGGFKLQNSFNDEFARLYVSSGDGNLRIYFDTSGLKGTFNDVSGVYSTVSDRRLKDNFQDLAFDWSTFNQLVPLSYSYKHDKDSRRYIGMIAQEVEEIYPELVTYAEDEDRYTMDYSGFGVLAIKAVQELKAENDAKDAVIEQLTKSLQDLQHTVAELSARVSSNEIK